MNASLRPPLALSGLAGEPPSHRIFQQSISRSDSKALLASRCTGWGRTPGTHTQKPSSHLNTHVKVYLHTPHLVKLEPSHLTPSTPGCDDIIESNMFITSSAQKPTVRPSQTSTTKLIYGGEALYANYAYSNSHLAFRALIVVK
jgi:hypothetical protein